MVKKPSNILQAIENFVLEDDKRTLTKVKEGSGMKILMVGAEVAPYSKVGGLSMVMSSLSQVLSSMGHEVCVFMPRYGFIEEPLYKLEMEFEGLKVPTGDSSTPFLICNVKSHTLDGVKTYFLENMEYYEKRANVYGYVDDPLRWALLSRGVLEFVKQGVFKPDIIHCHDWHTGLVPNYAKTFLRKHLEFKDLSIVLTIHNMIHQGMFDPRNVSELDFDDGRSDIASFFDSRLNKQNFLRRGILYADVITTVSQSYSKEIMTPEYGEGLDRLLLELREKVFGIVNGLNYKEFNPETDKLIEKNYSVRNIEARSVNKLALQKEFDLTEDLEIPILGFVGRLDHQKGVDLMISVLEKILARFQVQFVEVGGGDGSLAEGLQKLKRLYPEKVGVYTFPNFTLPRLIFSGSDMILYPSRFEPCGVVQLEAMRYGAIPIVRYVGGLKDTVTPLDSKTGVGTGFVFKEFDEFSLYGQIVRAIEVFKNKKLWNTLVENAMRADFSWNYSAREYEKLYLKAQSIKTTTKQ